MNKITLSFRSRMIFSILIIAGSTGVLGLTLVYFIGKNILEKNIGTEFQQTAEETSKSLTRLFEHHIDEAYTFGTSPSILDTLVQSNEMYNRSSLTPQTDRVAEIRNEWEENSTRSPLVERLLQNPASQHLQSFHAKTSRSDVNLGALVIDRMGIVVAASREPKKIYFGDQPWWDSTIHAPQDKQYISDIQLETLFKDIPKMYSVSIATPIYDPGEERAIGIFISVQSVRPFFELVTQVKMTETHHTMLARSDGNLLFCPIFLIKNHTLQPELVQNIAQDHSGWGMTRVDVHYPGPNSINGFAPVSIQNTIEGSFGGHRWYIFTSQDPRETYAPIRTLLAWIAGSGLMGIGLLGIFGFYATGRLIQPIKELQKGANLIALGNLQHRLDIKTGDEIEELASEFNEMAEKVRESYFHLEQKVAERTHDLEVRNKELSSLYTIASILNTSLNLKELLDEALSATLMIFRTEAGIIHLLKDASLKQISVHGFLTEIRDSSQKKEDEAILYREVVQKGMPISFMEESFTERPFKNTSFPSFIVIPIRSKGKMLGTLSLLDRRPRPFLKQELDLLAAIGNQIGIAIENSRLYEETRKVDQLKSDFVSKVSHEFRTPLTSIKGFIEILLSYQDISIDQQKEFLSIINQEADRLIRLINDVLDISKIEAGKVPWKIEPLDLAELINSTVKTMQSLIESKGLQLITEIEEDLPQVLGDWDQLVQVLNNLLSNAIKFTGKGEIVMFARRGSKGEIVAGVKDTGIGIPAGEATKIFTKFYQISRPEKGLPKGTGLGLAICREIIHHLGGEIWCESALGEGSVFYFTLSAASYKPVKGIQPSTPLEH